MKIYVYNQKSETWAEGEPAVAKLLEQLYAGPGERYVLRLASVNLNRVEKIFDRLILRHGLNEVEFHYEFCEELESGTL